MCVCVLASINQIYKNLNENHINFIENGKFFYKYFACVFRHFFFIIKNRQTCKEFFFFFLLLNKIYREFE